MSVGDIGNTTLDDVSAGPFRISKCERVTCITCSNRLCYDNFITNFVTGELFPLEINGSCRTSRCVYVLKCKQVGCNYQYIGHTINPCSSRVSQHKSSIIKGGGCRVLREHFTKVHSPEDISIMPIELFPDGIDKKEMENIEESWMIKMNTIFPYGLNLRVKKSSIMDASVTVMRSKSTIYSNFEVVKIHRIQRGGIARSSPSSNNLFDVDIFFDNLLDNDSLINIHALRTELCNLKKFQLKQVYIKVISFINDGIKDISRLHSCLLVKDLSWFYLIRMGACNRSNTKNSFFFVVNYVNKYVEHLDFR